MSNVPRSESPGFHYGFHEGVTAGEYGWRRNHFDGRAANLMWPTIPNFNFADNNTNDLWFRYRNILENWYLGHNRPWGFQTLHSNNRSDSSNDLWQFRQQERFLYDIAQGAYGSLLPFHRRDNSIAVAFVYTEDTDVVHALLNCSGVHGCTAGIYDSMHDCLQTNAQACAYMSGRCAYMYGCR